MAERDVAALSGLITKPEAELLTPTQVAPRIIKTISAARLMGAVASFRRIVAIGVSRTMLCARS